MCYEDDLSPRSTSKSKPKENKEAPSRAQSRAGSTLDRENDPGRTMPSRSQVDRENDPGRTVSSRSQTHSRSRRMPRSAASQTHPRSAASQSQKNVLQGPNIFPQTPSERRSIYQNSYQQSHPEAQQKLPQSQSAPILPPIKNTSFSHYPTYLHVLEESKYEQDWDDWKRPGSAISIHKCRKSYVRNAHGGFWTKLGEKPF